MAVPIDTQAVKDGIAQLATDNLKDYSVAATQDGIGLLESGQAEMQLYSSQLAAGEIDEDQLTGDLSEDLLALANMEKLKNSGLEQIRVGEFTQQVVGLLVSAAIKAALSAV